MKCEDLGSSRSTASGRPLRLLGCLVKLIDNARERLVADGAAGEKLVGAVRIHPASVAKTMNVLFRAQVFIVVGGASCALFFTATAALWRVLGGLALALSVALLVWALRPIFATDPAAAGRVSVPNPAALVLTDRHLRLYKHVGSLMPKLKALHHTWSVEDIVSIEGPVQVTTGSYEVHRLAIQFSDGLVLLADVRDGKAMDMAHRIFAALRLGLAS